MPPDTINPQTTLSTTLKKSECELLFYFKCKYSLSTTKKNTNFTNRLVQIFIKYF